VDASVRERLTVSNQAAQKFDVGSFNIWKLNELEVSKQYQIKFLNRFAALGNLSNGEDINRDLENIKENIKTAAKNSLGLCELKQHKLRFDEECTSFLYQRKQVKLQWLQDPNQSNVDNITI